MSADLKDRTTPRPFLERLGVNTPAVRGVLARLPVPAGRTVAKLPDSDTVLMRTAPRATPHHSSAGDPRDADALIGKGVALKALRRLPEAIETYRRAIEIAPRSTDAHLNLGNALALLNRHEVPRLQGRLSLGTVRVVLLCHEYRVPKPLVTPRHQRECSHPAVQLVDAHRLSQAARIFDVPDAELQGQAVQEENDRTAL
jgi:tetratricopeptide (TPR) repeat protein